MTAVRAASATDVTALRSLRNDYVLTSYATFDEERLSSDDLRRWTQRAMDIG